MLRSLLFILFFVFALPLHAESNPDWTSTLTPFRIADNLYYVGSRDLASYLVTTPAGNILINANLGTSPAQTRWQHHRARRPETRRSRCHRT